MYFFDGMGQIWGSPGAWIKPSISKQRYFKTGLRRLEYVSDAELLRNAPYELLYITDGTSTTEQYHIIAKNQRILWSEGSYNNSFILTTVQGRLQDLCEAEVLQKWEETLLERCAIIEEENQHREPKRRRRK